MYPRLKEFLKLKKEYYTMPNQNEIMILENVIKAFEKVIDDEIYFENGLESVEFIKKSLSDLASIYPSLWY